jgi:hypothetical protein
MNHNITRITPIPKNAFFVDIISPSSVSYELSDEILYPCQKKKAAINSGAFNASEK